VANYNEISLITLEPRVERELERNDTFCHEFTFPCGKLRLWNINPSTDRAFV
jgi:hypothetical protein